MMSLKPGTRLGPYEIAGLLGAGGMGEVYRARDTKLQRDVAVKVLPEDVTSSAERMGRFRREAHLLAALNHPNIAAIYGLEDSGPRLALVMELVEGPTLREQLARGPLPVGEALPMAQQIAEGLEYAHERGIIHRDLKPANIKITPEGKVKVLDFGLGKAFAPREASPEGASQDATQSPTLTAPATRSGVILGTAAYMAPEQARGRRVDRRADIWSFGCVLYEMLTGRRAFQGETVSDTLAAVLKAEPDWDVLPTDVGARLKELLARCLRKDPGRRLRDIGDARLEIEAAIAAGPAGVAGESGPGLPGARGVSLPQRIAWGTLGAVLAALVAVALALSGSWPRGGPQQTRPLRVSILHTEGSEVGAPAISPDGNRIAYRARRADGIPLLWVRDLDSFEARPLAGTEDSQHPFWSPCAGKTGEVLRMEVSYGEGVASHAGPESCANGREAGGEALTGVRAGRVLSRENFGPLRGADAVETGGRPHPSRRQRETRMDPARSETPSTHGSTSHGNREVPRPPAAREAGGCTGKSKDIRR